eukprot:TRINITY_DN10022_c0_g1_i1.p1 TRINITY_DN10022_c0_g1~~TRINITY_DN10022_c0_g1_i1.p1  ORF type:complete len:758 (-),score=152.55 TRINITY_DN10022_c0_g1_i1:224-2497(-)
MPEGESVRSRKLAVCAHEARIWRIFPGYDASVDSDDSEEVSITAAAEQRLQEVEDVIGRPLGDRPPVVFKIAPSRQEVNLRPAADGESSRLPSFKIARIHAPLVAEFFLSNGLKPTDQDDWSIQWSGPGMKDAGYRELQSHQRVNHFPGSTELTRKDRMWSHLDRMRLQFGGAFDFVPETFILPQQIHSFRKRYTESSDLWILKPQNSSCGRGIALLRSLKEIPANQEGVVSQYVKNPLLIQGLKFDLRIYVLVTSFDPLRAYIYREGLVRFASKPYSVKKKHLSDAFRHLTNYSVNKFSKDFQENKEVEADNYGHKWSLSALNKHLKAVGISSDTMWSRIMDLCVKTLLAVEPTISSRSRAVTAHHGNCFECYGFDVLVDSNLKPWLMEVNLSPSMQAESPLDWQVKSALLRDVFNLVGVSGPARRRKSTANPIVKKSDGAKASNDQRPGSAPGVGDLSTLGEGELKALSQAFMEAPRRRNFIRLYPTRRAVARYEPLLTRECFDQIGRSTGKPTLSQHLAASLFGEAAAAAGVPALPRTKSTANKKRQRATVHIGAGVLRSSSLPSVSASAGGRGSPQEGSARSQAWQGQATASASPPLSAASDDEDGNEALRRQNSKSSGPAKLLGLSLQRSASSAGGLSSKATTASSFSPATSSPTSPGLHDSKPLRRTVSDLAQLRLPVDLRRSLRGACSPGRMLRSNPIPFPSKSPQGNPSGDADDEDDDDEDSSSEDLPRPTGPLPGSCWDANSEFINSF